MPVNLDKTLKLSGLTNDEKLMLEDLQCNILKGHGRRHTQQIFLKFAGGQSNLQATQNFIRDVLANQIVTQQKQLADSVTLRMLSDEERAEKKLESSPIVVFFLTAKGYEKLGIEEARTPSDPSFRAGMKGQREMLKDPLLSKWDLLFRGEIHAMLLIADANPGFVMNKRDQLFAGMPGSIIVLGTEIGNQQEDDRGEGVEHFGYVDGRSQPLMLEEDVEKEREAAGLGKNTSFTWDPKFPIGTALVPDLGGATTNSHGSYFVFRKLEEDVKGFKDREQLLANKLGFINDRRELAGALVIGRFEDGTPVLLSDEETGKIENNFDFSGDVNGSKCPFASHIRKSNPRGESVGTFAANLDEERSHIMARRGITYGYRAKDLSDRPSKDVGLLFMAYQNDIGNQFEFTQVNWVNNSGFVKNGTGIDPVIGQGRTSSQQWPSDYGSDDRVSFKFNDFVHMKGGEYFFAPSISFLKTL
jgi:Dyp-type peroxidase family